MTTKNFDKKNKNKKRLTKSNKTKRFNKNKKINKTKTFAKRIMTNKFKLKIEQDKIANKE